MQEIPFFQTEHQSPSHQRFIEKKTSLGNYVSHLDLHINKAMSFQNRALDRKKQSLLHTLDKMREQVQKESEKTRKTEEFFQIHCEKILKDDITKWDDHKIFFKTLFEMYDLQIKEKQKIIDAKKKEVQNKNLHLKELLRALRKPVSIPQLSQRIAEKQVTAFRQYTIEKQQTEATTIDRNTRLIRIKTEGSLPSLNRVQRVKTMVDCEQSDREFKNYMRPIKTEKKAEENECRMIILDMLDWYKQNRGSAEFNWFEKVIFIDRNYRKVREWFLKLN